MNAARQSQALDIRRMAVPFLVFLALCGIVTGQEKKEPVDDWKPDPKTDHMTGKVTERIKAVKVPDDVGGDFDVVAVCNENAALALMVYGRVALTRDCSSARIGIDGRVVGAGNLVPPCEVDAVNNGYKFFFLGDLTKAMRQTKELYSRITVASAPDAESKDMAEGIVGIFGTAFDALAPTLNASTLNTFRAAGVPVMSDVLGANSVKVEIPLANGNAALIKLHPQEAAFKDYVRTACVSTTPPEPKVAAPEGVTDSGGFHGIGAPKTDAPPLRGTGAGDTNLDSRTYAGDVEGFAAALPKFIQQATANGLPAQDYGSEVQYIVATARACGNITPEMVAAGTDRGIIQIPRFQEQYIPCLWVSELDVSANARRKDARSFENLGGSFMMTTKPRGRWGDGTGFTMAINWAKGFVPYYETRKASDYVKIVEAAIVPPSGMLTVSGRGAESFGAPAGSPSPSSGPIAMPIPSKSDEGTLQPTRGSSSASAHLITDTYPRTLEIIGANASKGVPDPYLRLMQFFTPIDICKLGGDVNSPQWTCEKTGDTFTMPGDLREPPEFWEKTSPQSYLQKCKATSGHRGPAAIEAAIAVQGEVKKGLVICTTLYNLGSRRDMLLYAIAMKK